MQRTHFRASALPLALLLSATAACAGAPPSLPGPTPVAEAAEEPASLAPVTDAAVEAPAARTGWNGAAGAELLGRASYDLPVEANQSVASEVSFLVNERHDVVGRWLERGARYEGFVRETFAAAGIPRDLHHLAMVESGYQPTVRSRAGAVGMWQFMPATGRGMGLRIDDTVDERMDPVRSTRAAARHLRQLWRDFGGDWPLAAAAYNAGGGRISRGVQAVGARSFWELSERGTLAQETKRYVPRLFAVTIIAKDPARFGYAPQEGLVRRFEFDSLQVDLPTPLPVLARLGGVALGEISDLNPHLRRGIAPPFYWVWVPKGTASATQQAYRGSDFRRRGGFATYTLRAGEDLASIARAGGLTPDQLRDLNLGVNVDALRAGDRVRLYADAARVLAARPGEGVAGREMADGAQAAGPALAGRPVAPQSQGDALAARDASPSTGPVLAGPPVTPASTTAIATTTATAGATSDSSAAGVTRPVLAGPAATPRAGGEARRDAPRPAEHVVKAGETLWSISRSYDTTVDAIRAANDMGPDAVIQAGQTLRLPRVTDGGR